MKILKVERTVFEKYGSKLKLTKISDNKYVYKKSAKYKIRKLLKIIGMILWIPSCIPINIFIAIIEGVKDIAIEIFDAFKIGSVKSYLSDIKKEYHDIFKCIIEIKE